MTIIEKYPNPGPLTVGVIAGTPVDTRFGVDYIESLGYQAIAAPLSKTATGQTFLQFNREVLENKVLSTIKSLKTAGCQEILIFCNSIGLAINMDLVKRRSPIPISSPIDTYGNVPWGKSPVGVMAANGQCIANIERYVLTKNKSANIIGLSLLPIILDIELGLSPRTIIEKYNIQNTVFSLQSMGCKDVILACTHFHYLWPELKLKIKGCSGLRVIPTFDGIINLTNYTPERVSHCQSNQSFLNM